MKSKILKKLHKARILIKESNLKKLGHNNYSGYDYYTPEQVSHLAGRAEKELNIINLFNLKKTDNGLVGELQIVDIDSGESRTFVMATDIPEIKATNIAQQLGGTMTYTERYLLMTAYDIKDNNLDFDTPKKPDATKKDGKAQGSAGDELPWLTSKEKGVYIKKIQAGNYGHGKEAWGKFLNGLLKVRKIRKEYREEMKTEFESGFNKEIKS